MIKLPTLINYIDGYVVEFDTGRFDNWCVYLKEPNGQRYAPKDEQIFSNLKQLGKKYSNAAVYSDFEMIYKATVQHLDPKVIATITELAGQYGNDKLEAEILFSVIYGGMVAEENKKNTILKKRIKRLGIHQLLVEGLTPTYCASFSYGKRWRALDALMSSKGI